MNLFSPEAFQQIPGQIALGTDAPRIKPTGAALAAFKASIHAGDRLLCVENTYRPEINGTTRTITRNGATVADCMMDGERFRLEWPSRVCDVLAVSADEITYRIGRDAHTVTLRRLPR